VPRLRPKGREPLLLELGTRRQRAEVLELARAPPNAVVIATQVRRHLHRLAREPAEAEIAIEERVVVEPCRELGLDPAAETRGRRSGVASPDGAESRQRVGHVARRAREASERRPEQAHIVRGTARLEVMVQDARREHGMGDAPGGARARE